MDPQRTALKMTALATLAAVALLSTPGAAAYTINLTRAGELMACEAPDYSMFPDGPVIVNSLNADLVSCSSLDPSETPRFASDCFFFIVCAKVNAAAYAPLWCWEAATHQAFHCTYGGATGSAFGEFGMVTGVLTGYANGVPLNDYCFAPLGKQTCNLAATADRYPGEFVQVTATVTATSAYGSAQSHDTAFDGA